MGRCDMLESGGQLCHLMHILNMLNWHVWPMNLYVVMKPSKLQNDFHKSY
jgi:hypothetical protein